MKVTVHYTETRSKSGTLEIPDEALVDYINLGYDFHDKPAKTIADVTEQDVKDFLEDGDPQEWFDGLRNVGDLAFEPERVLKAVQL